MGELAESQVLDTIVNGSGQGMRECWRRRLESMRADLGYADSSALERLLIQQVTLCWLNLNLTEYRHTNIMKQSITDCWPLLGKAADYGSAAIYKGVREPCV
jgi:hypothetical protein